ncbi:MAG TPA: hypothetical protein DIT13_01335 [Verrucomicrobiales bacterium]|nr:hypothetical protein [Verrucomicrobiales bacterium]HRJ09419.1 hypothetical protein [Prosthecobacter sp.]HRK15843.1 hypothetical protein [Prosthecobacter sp.]
MSIQQIPVAEFCEHAMDALQSVEKNHVLVELVRDGQIIAYLSPAPQPSGNTGTLADWMGTGAGYTLAAGESLDDPTFAAEEWEDFPESGQ